MKVNSIFSRSLPAAITVALFAFALAGCASSSKAVKAGESESETCLAAVGQYITPDQFGARGDGKTDDTEALRAALYESNSTGKILFIPAGRDYRVRGALNYYGGRYMSYTLNMLGTIPVKQATYSPGVSGGISVDKGVSLFENATIKGTIERVCIVGKRDLSTSLFKKCTCTGIIIHGCNISNFGSVFLDTQLNQISEITYNNCLSVLYFSRNESTSSGLTDSYIAFNYINGGQELNDNVCFEWSSFNGSTVSHNFIDYYRTIYQPKALKSQSFEGPNSTANQYQVFRYLYYPGANITTVAFSSYADCFNWTKPSSLETLANFKPIQYKGKDGKTYDYPPFIAICHYAWKTNIVAAKLERNIGNCVFVHSLLTEYENNVFDVEFVSNNPTNTGMISYLQGDQKPFYNGGKYMANQMRITGLDQKVDKLPTVQTNWTAVPTGQTVICNGRRYQSANVCENGKWKATWREVAE